MLIDGININLEEIRCELEHRFYPTFGLPLDIARIVVQPEPPQDGDPRLFAPPPELQDIYNPWLMEYQWERLITLVREPVKEIFTSQGYRAVQVLGQTVLLVLPNGLLHAWVWDSTRERGMHLKRLSHDAVALSGHYFENDWLLRLAELVTLEIRAHVCFDELRACSYGAWCFELFAKVLAEHADLAWMRKRIQHTLALEPHIFGLSQETISRLGLPGSVTVAQYNHVLRRFAVLKDVQRESPQLIGLYEALCTHVDFPEDGEPLQRLKRFLKAQGLTQRGWNMVLSMTASDLAPIYEIYEGVLLSAVLDYVLLLDSIGFHVSRPHWFIRAIWSGNGGVPNGNGGFRRDFAEQGYLACASHVVRLYFEGKDAPSEDQTQELKLVLEWLSRIRQPLTRTQKQGGWSWLLRKAMEWDAAEVLLAQAQYKHWPTPCRHLQAGPLVLRAISNDHDLVAEGQTMRHCVGTYASQCSTGATLIFSVFQDGKHIATAEYRRELDGWILNSAMGPRNSRLSLKVQSDLRNAALMIGNFNAGNALFNQPGAEYENNDHKSR
jgi:PcfJ-like protein